MYSYFCSNGCYNDFANKYIQQIIAIAPRNEPLETPIEDPEKTKHTTSWGHTYYDTRIREREV
jgi:YHS domain-containing protein